LGDRYKSLELAYIDQLVEGIIDVCPDYPGSKDLSRDLQPNCVISFFFRLYLVLHAYAVRFDVIGTVAFFGFAFWTKQAQKSRASLYRSVGWGYYRCMPRLSRF
jgi:hypothetical protein